MTDNSNFKIPNVYKDIQRSKIETNRNLVGSDISFMAQNANYLAANGIQKIPQSYVGLEFVDTVPTTAFKFRILDHAKSNINERYWTLGISGSTTVPSYLYTSFVSTYGATTIGLNPVIPGKTSVFIKDSMNQVTSTGSLVDDIVLTVYKVTDTAITTANIVNSLVDIGMVECPRTVVNPTTQGTEFGVDTVSCQSGKPIFTSPSNHNASLSGIVNSFNHFSASSRVGKGLWSFYRPYDSAGTTTYGSFDSSNYCGSNTNVANTKTNLFTTPLVRMKPLVYATQQTTTQLSRSCQIYIYAAVQNAAEVGQFQITSSYGFATISVASTTLAWYSASLNVQTENCMTSLYGGLPGTVLAITGNIDINATKTTTVGTNWFNVWSIQIMEL